MKLIEDWRTRHPPTTPADDSIAPSGADVGRKGGAVAPGSFLGLLLSAKDKTAGHALTDMQVNECMWL